MFVSRFQKILVILYQSGETQIWVFINVLGAFHHTVDCNYEHSVGRWTFCGSRCWLQFFFVACFSLLPENTVSSFRQKLHLIGHSVYSRTVSSVGSVVYFALLNWIKLVYVLFGSNNLPLRSFVISINWAESCDFLIKTSHKIKTIMIFLYFHFSSWKIIVLEAAIRTAIGLKNRPRRNDQYVWRAKTSTRLLVHSNFEQSGNYFRLLSSNQRQLPDVR